MSNCNWEPIHGFVTPGEYRRFLAWLESQVDVDMVESLTVDASQLGDKVKMFKCKESGEIWLLIPPDERGGGVWDSYEYDGFKSWLEEAGLK